MVFILLIYLNDQQLIYIRVMDLQPRDDSNHRKQKKKKHHSRSQSKKHKKEKDRGGSKEHKKKDKDKKKHKSKSKDRQERDYRDDRRDRGQERKDKDKQRQEKDKERELRKEKEREQRRQKQRQQRREKQEKQRERSRDKKDRDRSKEKGEKSKQKGKDRSQRKQAKEKEKERSKSKQKQRSQQKAKKRDHSKSRKRDDSRDRKREDPRREDKQRSRQQQPFRRKYDDRDRRGKERLRQDKYERWRKQAQFRFDSPPKSDESDMSDDPQKMDKLNKMKAQKQLVTSKADRKLYLGNLPPNITSNQLMQMLNSALKKMEINCQEDGDSIVSAWISPDGVGHYAFVQFRTAQQATAGLALNGASLYGYQLKLGRPKQYIEYHKQLLSEFGSDGNIDTILRKVQAMGGFIQPPRIEQRLVIPPSKVVVLKHIVTVEQLAIDEQYNEIVEDVTEMARRHGELVKVVIPRPMEIDLQEVKTRVKGLGYIFIKYKSAEQAKYARKQFIKQMFSQRSVACSFFAEKKFDEGDLDVIDKVIIDF